MENLKSNYKRKGMTKTAIIGLALKGFLSIYKAEELVTINVKFNLLQIRFAKYCPDIIKKEIMNHARIMILNLGKDDKYGEIQIEEGTPYEANP